MSGHLIIGTAGHIDHGKTSLVRALTGIDTDRLKEEKARGITIELGFAHLDLEGWRFGVVDVPGHERFIRAMVAGAVGIDIVVMVVAADEGVMPQTREHLDICSLLGVKRGVVALTKADVASEELLELAKVDLNEHLAGSFLEGARIVACSALTGAGLDDLRAELVRLAKQVPARDPAELFRLPLDRVFTMKGFGTVVTGTVAGGTARVGDELVALPSGRATKVRGAQVHGGAALAVAAGQRAALNLGGLAREDIQRGEVLAHPGTFTPAAIVDVRVQFLHTNRAPVKSRARVIVHAGTAQVLGTIVLAGGREAAPGSRAACQLRFERPLAVMPGDRFILRGFTAQQHYGTTLGGGEIVRVHTPRLRRAGSETVAAIETFAAASAQARVALEVRARGRAGIAPSELAGRIGAAPAAVSAAIPSLIKSGELIAIGEAMLVHAEVFHDLATTAAEIVRGETTREGVPREELRTKLSHRLDPRLFDAVIADTEKSGVLACDRDLVTLRARAQPAGTVPPLAEKLRTILEAAALQPPRPDELPALAGASAIDVQRALESLQRAGGAIKMKDLWFAATPVAAVRERLRAFLVEKTQITPQEWKEMVGASRKFAIPLAEHFDAEKLTLRVGDLRKLRGR